MPNTSTCLPSEIARINAIHRLKILDSAPNESFDRMTRTVAELFKLPIAAVSLTDSNRQWFKSRVGVVHHTIPRLQAPCAQVTHTSAMLVIHDLLADNEYKTSFLANAGIRFYAGAPLITHDGFSLGALCVLGFEPRHITSAEQDALRDMAAMVVAQIELQYALGRINPSSGLPNQTQFIEDFKDLSMDAPRGQLRLAALVNLVSPDRRILTNSWRTPLRCCTRAALPARFTISPRLNSCSLHRPVWRKQNSAVICKAGHSGIRPRYMQAS